MAEEKSNQNNFWQTNQSVPKNLEETSPAVLAPPSEVKVRTLRSDLESMSKSGGALPQFETVKLSVSQESVSQGAETNKRNSNPIIFISIIVILFSILGYFAYQIFFRVSPRVETGQAPITQQPATQSTTQFPSIPNAQPIAEQEFIHHSLFKKPADHLLGLAIQNTVENSTDLQTFVQKLNALLTQAGSSGNLFEINVKDTSGKDFGVNQIFSSADTGVLDSQFVLTHFNPDATFFVYKDKNGFWPGMIIALKPTENWLYIQNDIQKLEKSSKLINFYLSSPGDKVGDFKDDVISDQQVRTLSFTAPGATFVYGWLRGNLILSTSLDGLKEALARL